MGLEALYPGRNLSKANQAHKVYPHLLRNLIIDRSSQVWSTDITDIPMAKSFFYLVAVIDWYSRRILAWRLSNAMDNAFCIDAHEEAIERNDAPEFFDTEQGCQFASEYFTGTLKSNDIAVSMDGKRGWGDNVFVKRLWPSVKHEVAYLHAYDDIRTAQKPLGYHLEFYNTESTH